MGGQLEVVHHTAGLDLNPLPLATHIHGCSVGLPWVIHGSKRISIWVGNFG